MKQTPVLWTYQTKHTNTTECITFLHREAKHSQQKKRFGYDPVEMCCKLNEA